MILELITATVLNCPVTITKVTPSSLTWEEVDISQRERARVRCGQLYLRSPCLIEFRKVDVLMYQAICGRGKK